MRLRLVPRTWRGWTAVTVLVTLLLAASGVFAWVEVAASRYQPLTVVLEDVSVIGPTTSTDQVGPPFQSLAVPYVDHGTFDVLMRVRNTGTWGVTVTGVDLPDPEVETLWRATTVQIGHWSHGEPGWGFGTGTMEVDSTEPFHPVSLDGGQELSLVLKGRMQDCEFYLPGSGNEYTGWTIDYTVAGQAHSATLSWPLEIDVTVPQPYSCPRANPYSHRPVTTPA